MKCHLTLLACLLAAGCATPTTILRNDATGQVARCGGGVAGSIAGGMIGYSIEQSSDRECVRDYRARGFEVAGTPQPASTPSPPPLRTLPVASAPAISDLRGQSTYLIEAEGLAKNSGCAPPAAAMTSKGAGQESFIVACPSGVSLAMQCGIEGCRILR